MNFFTYDNLTGKILSNGSAPDNMIEFQSTDEATARQGSADEVNEYYDIQNKTISTRLNHNVSIDKTSLLAFDVESSLLTGVPNGSTIDIAGQIYTADGTDIELKFYAPGDYLIKVDSFPFTDFEVIINAT